MKFGLFPPVVAKHFSQIPIINSPVKSTVISPLAISSQCHKTILLSFHQYVSQKNLHVLLLLALQCLSLAPQTNV